MPVHCTVLVKLLDKYHPLSLAVHRHWGNVIPSVPIILYYRYWKKVPLFDEVWPLLPNHGKNLKNVIGLCVSHYSVPFYINMRLRV